MTGSATARGDIPRAVAGVTDRLPSPTAPSMSIRPSGLSAVALAIGLLLGIARV